MNLHDYESRIVEIDTSARAPEEKRAADEADGGLVARICGYGTR